VPNARYTKLIGGAQCVTEWPNPDEADIPDELVGSCRMLPTDDEYIAYNYTDTNVTYSYNSSYTSSVSDEYLEYTSQLREAGWDKIRCEIWLKPTGGNETPEFDTTSESYTKCGCPSGSLRKIYHMVLFIVVFVFPLAVLVYCYGKVYYEIHNVQKAVREHGQSTLQRDRKARALIYILLLVAGFVICWGPIYVFHVVQAHGFLVTDVACETMTEGVKV